MKRFLFLVCGAALLLIAGGRFLIILADAALAPDSYRATVRIQLSENTSLPQNALELSGKILSTLGGSPKFVEQLTSEKLHGPRLNEKEAAQWLQKFTAIKQSPGSRDVLLTYYGYDLENTSSVANALARAWVEDNSISATIFPTAAQVNSAPILAITGFFRSSHVYIPLLLALAGAVIFFLGWRMPSSPASTESIPAISAKY
jgi:hypothetical protein